MCPLTPVLITFDDACIFCIIRSTVCATLQHRRRTFDDALHFGDFFFTHVWTHISRRGHSTTAKNDTVNLCSSTVTRETDSLGLPCTRHSMSLRCRSSTSLVVGHPPTCSETHLRRSLCPTIEFAGFCLVRNSCFSTGANATKLFVLRHKVYC